MLRRIPNFSGDSYFYLIVQAIDSEKVHNAQPSKVLIRSLALERYLHSYRSLPFELVQARILNLETLLSYYTDNADYSVIGCSVLAGQANIHTGQFCSLKF